MSVAEHEVNPSDDEQDEDRERWIEEWTERALQDILDERGRTK